MAVNYTWNIIRLECYPQYASEVDVVFNVYWQYKGTDDNGISSARGGNTQVTYVQGEPYTPYDQLTQDQVIGWVTPTISDQKLAEMQSGIVGDIDYITQQMSANNPVAPPLPWQ